MYLAIKMQRVFYTILVLSTISCSTVHQINSNNKATSRIVSSLLEDNGNVYYLQSTYSKSSVIWTYREDGIEIYRLHSGKLSSQKHLKTNDYNTLLLNMEDFAELDDYLELDGDILGVQNRRMKQEYPVCFDCILKGSLNSKKLNSLIQDIISLELWPL